MIKSLFCIIVGVGVLLYIKNTQDLNHVSAQFVGLGIAGALLTVYGVLTFFTGMGNKQRH